MLEILLPIGEFLERAIVASVDGPHGGSMDYAAMVMVCAREADAVDVHRSWMRDWRSIDDLTGENVVIVAPGSDGSAYVRGEPRYEGLVAPGLQARVAGSSVSWSRSFWEALPVDREGLAARHTRRPPRHADEHLTSNASKISSFLGLREADLPCVVILSFRGQEAFRVPITPDFDLYALVKTCMNRYGPPEPYLEVLDQRDVARRALDEIEGGLRRLERTLARGDRQKQGTRGWPDQAEAVLDTLALVVNDPLLSRVAEDAKQIADLIAHGARATEGDLSRASRLLAAVPRPARAGHGTKMQRLHRQLPRALSSLPVTVSARDEETSTIEQELATTHCDVDRARDRLGEAEARLRLAGDEFGFSPAVRSAAAALGLQEVPRAAWRRGWTGCDLVLPERRASAG